MMQSAPVTTGKNWRISNQFFWVALFSSAILPLILGYLSPYVVIILTPLYFIAHLYHQRSLRVKIDLIGWVFVAILLIQVLLAIITATMPLDIVYGLNFLPLLLYVFALAILQNATLKNPLQLFAMFALGGALLAMFMALYAVFGLNISRGGYGLVNANDLSGLALLFGFLALIGLTGNDSRRHIFLLLGPVAGLATILLTGSRGALLAYGAMVFVSVFFLVPARFRISAWTSIVSLMVLVLLALVFVIQDSRIMALPQIIQNFLTGNVLSDNSAYIRLVLYMGGIEAFLQSPVFGHGWANFVDVAATHFSDTAVRNEVIGIPQLHNDVINFAVASGVIGVLTYIACLIAPLVAVFRMPVDAFIKAKQMGVVLLVTCYVVRGLTDMMIGFEYGTSFFVIILALLMSLSISKANGVN